MHRERLGISYLIIIVDALETFSYIYCSQVLP